VRRAEHRPVNRQECHARNEHGPRFLRHVDPLPDFVEELLPLPQNGFDNGEILAKAARPLAELFLDVMFAVGLHKLISYINPG
jgi:hypothetical protein